MIITASELKRLLKTLSPVRTDTFRFDTQGIVAQDSDVVVVVDGPKFGGTFNTNSKKLSSVVNRMSGQIDISQSGNKLILKSAKAVVELEIQPVKPVTLPQIADQVVTFALPEFKKALAVASASASPAKSSPPGVARASVQLQSLSYEESGRHTAAGIYGSWVLTLSC